MTITHLIKRILRFIFGVWGFVALLWMLLVAYVMGKPLLDEILGYRLWKAPMMSLARTVRDSGRCLYTGKRLEDDPDLRVHVIRSFLKGLMKEDSYASSSVDRWLVNRDVSVDEFLGPEQRRVDAYEGRQAWLPPPVHKKYRVVGFRWESDIEAISDEFLKGDLAIYEDTVDGTAMIPGRSIQKVSDAAAPDINRQVRSSDWGIADTFLGYGRTMFELRGYGSIHHCWYGQLSNSKPGASEPGEVRFGFDSSSCEQTKRDIAEVRRQQQETHKRAYIFVSNCGEVYGVHEAGEGGDGDYRLFF